MTTTGKLNRTKKLINKYFTWVRLVHEFLTLQTVYDMKVWSEKNKNLYTAMLEWLIENPVKYMLIGFFISLAVPFTWYQCGVVYWLTIDLIRRVKERQ